MAINESREDIVARVKERADIVQIIGEVVDLKKSGARYLGLCPFHGEKTPSFSVHSGQQFFHCFGCGESGDVFSFMMKYHNLDFPSALKELAAKYSIALPERPRSAEQAKQDQFKKEMYAVSEKAAALYSRYLGTGKAAGARAYLTERGIPKDILTRFGIGYAPSVEGEGWDYFTDKLTESEKKASLEAGLSVKNDRGGVYDRFRDRVLFPIYEISGQVCGFGGRIIGEGQPKYLNSPESRIYNKSKLLLGLYQQKDAIRKKNQAIIVEGNFDLISLVCNGYENVVAPLGTALTREQLRLLKRFCDEIVLLFDGDEAGVKAAVRSVPHFLAEQVSGRVALLPEGHDPDTFVRERGLVAVEELVAGAETLPEFVFGQLVKEYGLTLDGKSKIVEELRPLVKAAASPLQRTVVITHFAEQLGISAEQLDSMLDRSVPPPVEEAPPPPPEPPVMRAVEQIEPLSKSQRRLVEFMVLNPSYLGRLEDGGLRECIAGSVGEVLFLQLRSLIAEHGEIEPEELLSKLPGGAERELVSDLLLEAPDAGDEHEADSLIGAEAEELLEWMRVYRLQRASRQLLDQISGMKTGGDFSLLQELLQKKQNIDRELKGPEL
ncbi:DNA primase [Desulfosediminicola sp.]|uniref:DNA primase n=1 Tax=Desulfosediminicola sp. TaxID=2886825 RepID=UPI003AF222D8